MSDPRYTDARDSQSQFSDPVGRRNDGAGTWGWVAGIAVIALIAIFLIAGGKSVSNSSSSSIALPAASGGGAVVPQAPGTTGMGSPSPAPARKPATNNQ